MPAMDFSDRVLYRQVDPLKLATDTVTGIVGLFILWRHRLTTASGDSLAAFRYARDVGWRLVTQRCRVSGRWISDCARLGLGGALTAFCHNRPV